jgi:hypothetical protein
MFNGYFMRNMGHDVFRYRGLSKNGLRLFEFMLGNPNLTIIQIAEKTGLNLKTIRRKIAKMKIAGLVLSDSGKRNAHFRVIDKPNIDQAAVILGTAGDGKRQREQYRRDREEYRIFREQKKIDELKSATLN